MDGRRLLERPIDFGYAYRMRCSRCGQASLLTGADYLRLNDEADARMDCAHCHVSIHFGPLAAAIRDEDDIALDDALLNRLSWYHTSTYLDWPSAEFESEQRASLSTERVRALVQDPEHLLSTMLDKALHLGTYEAAIENMYRRMRNQGDAKSSFYLHRVEISIRDGRVNEGYRDENEDTAAQLSVSELTDLGLDALRYLNVWEAAGSISLAVRPDAVVAIQSIPIPAPPDPTNDLPPRVARLVDDVHARLPSDPSSDQDRLELYRLRSELTERLIAELLPDVNAEVADRFAFAISSAHGWTEPGGFEELTRTFAVHATLLTESAAYLLMLDEAERRRP